MTCHDIQSQLGPTQTVENVLEDILRSLDNHLCTWLYKTLFCRTQRLVGAGRRPIRYRGLSLVYNIKTTILTTMWPVNKFQC